MVVVDEEQNSFSTTLTTRGVYDLKRLRSEIYFKLIDDELTRIGPGAVMLDVGCGRGVARNSTPIFEWSRRSESLWGVEPDVDIETAPCFDKVWRTTLEEADIPSQSVDLAISYFVIEHIHDPEAFCRALHRALKPGGVFIAATVNGRCLFAKAARLLRAIRLDEWVLRLSHGKSKADDYHYPTTYRLNTTSAFQALSTAELPEQAAWRRIELDYLENNEWYHYFPAGLRWCGRIYSRWAKPVPERYSYLFVRMEAVS